MTPEYRVILHKEIFTMVYHGNGGWNWRDLYNMPVYLRMFYSKEMSEAKERELQAKTASPRKPEMPTGPF